jgi:hypothetical protein
MVELVVLEGAPDERHVGSLDGAEGLIHEIGGHRPDVLLARAAPGQGPRGVARGKRRGMTRRILPVAMAISTLVAGAAGSACSKEKEPEPTAAAAAVGSMPAESGHPAPSGAAPATPPAPAALAAAGAITWTAPAAWRPVTPTSPMRKATFKIPKAAGDDEDAELSVTQVGGGLDMNLTRWEKQFAGGAPLARSTRKAGDLDVTLVEGKGTLTGSGMPGAPATPKDHQMLLGAIVTSVEPAYFFKLTGPEKTVAAARPDFEKFVSSYRKP